MSRRSSVRIDGVGDILSRTTNLPPITAFTVCGWFKIAVDRNDVSGFMAYGDAVGSQQYALLTTADGVTLEIWQGGADTLGSVLTVGVWYHMAVTVSGTGAGQCLAYLNGKLDITASGASSIDPQALYIGNSNASEWLNGCAADVRVWDKVLNPPEIRAEMLSPIPVRRRDLNAWYEFPPGRLALDSSGRGRHLTIAGAHTTEAGPPLLALPRRRIVGKASATAGILRQMMMG